MRSICASKFGTFKNFLWLKKKEKSPDQKVACSESAVFALVHLGTGISWNCRLSLKKITGRFRGCLQCVGQCEASG